MLNQQGFGCVTCLPCQFTWDPLAQSGQRAGSYVGIRPRVMCQLHQRGLKEGETRSTCSNQTQNKGSLNQWHWNSVGFAESYHFVPNFDWGHFIWFAPNPIGCKSNRMLLCEWQVRKSKLVATRPQCVTVPCMVHIIIVANEWQAGKCASIMCTFHLIRLMQATYIMQLKNRQKHWLWWNTSKSFHVCYHYSPTVWPVTVSRGLCCIAQSKEEDWWQMNSSPTSHPHQSLVLAMAFKMKMASIFANHLLPWKHNSVDRW